MPDADSDNHSETRQERRERKLKEKEGTYRPTGKGLVKIYRDAVLKRLKGK